LVFVVTDQIGGTNTWDEVHGAGTHHLMTANSIREWSERGVEFLPHSHTHANLPALDAAAIARELDQSRNTIHALTGRDPIAFAYPYGLFDDRTLLLARQRFACAFTTKEGINGIATDAMRLHRTQVRGTESRFWFLWRARFGENTWDDLRSGLGRVRRTIMADVLPHQ
jgi:hypothetical protein